MRSQHVNRAEGEMMGPRRSRYDYAGEEEKEDEHSTRQPQNRDEHDVREALQSLSEREAYLAANPSTPAEIEQSGAVWAAVYRPKEPENLFSLFERFWNSPMRPDVAAAVRAAQKTGEVQPLSWLTAETLPRVQSVPIQDIENLSPEGRAAQTARLQAVKGMTLFNAARQLPTMLGQFCTVFNGILTLPQLRIVIKEDVQNGWRLPGGFAPDTPSNPNMAFRSLALYQRDMEDNTSHNHGSYLPGSHNMEGFGRKAIVEIAGLKFPLREQVELEGQYQTLRRHEIDWDMVAAAGSLGNIVVIDGDDQEIEESSEERQLHAPYESRDATFETRLNGGMHENLAPSLAEVMGDLELQTSATERWDHAEDASLAAQEDSKVIGINM